MPSTGVRRGGSRDRGASTQLGAVLLFGFLIAAITIWQVQVVPEANAEIEYTHSQRVQGDLQEVRNGIVSAPGGSTTRSVTIEMGPEYPTRTLFVNPPPPTGTLRTAGTANTSLNLTLRNATAIGDETADFWNGTARDYSTGGLLYEPGYNVYQNAPEIRYENGVLYERHPAGQTTTVSGQTFVDGRRLTFVTLTGNISTGRNGAFSLDLRPTSSSTRTVSVTNESGGNVTVSVATRLSAETWTDLLDGEFVDQSGYVVRDSLTTTPLGNGFNRLTFELRANETYELRMANVRVGGPGTGSESAYVTDVSGDNRTVNAGGNTDLVVEVRDRFNNPVSGIDVSAVQPTNGSVTPDTVTTGSDGRATFTYEAPDVAAEATVRINIGGAGPARQVVFNLSVTDPDAGTGASDAYATTWTNPDANPDNDDAALSACSASSCTWDTGQLSELNLTATTDPSVDGGNLSFSVSDQSIAVASTSAAETLANGNASTLLSPRNAGTVQVYVSGGGSGDVIDVTVENVPGVLTLLETSFEGGTLASAGWSYVNTSGDGEFGVDDRTSNAGNYSAYTGEGAGYIHSEKVTTTGLQSVSVEFWVQKGDDAFSEDPDFDEDLIVEYYAKNGTWVEIDRFDPGSYADGEEIARNITVTSSGAIHDDFRLRFRQQSGSGDGFDYWHIDDVAVRGNT
ncbi:MAG: hypothetical protein V5A33_00620 [Halobacteriales archaeon]